MHQGNPPFIHHLRGPALHELFHTVERVAEVVSGRGEAQAEVRWHVETVSGREQDSALGGGLAEGTGVPSADEPREGCRSALRADPAENVAKGAMVTVEDRWMECPRRRRDSGNRRDDESVVWRRRASTLTGTVTKRPERNPTSAGARVSFQLQFHQDPPDTARYPGDGWLTNRPALKKCRT
jgi:hypothetical protein